MSNVAGVHGWSLIAALIIAGSPAASAGQATVAAADSARGGVILRGVVRSVAGAALAGANVFILETLDGAITDTTGAFVIRAKRPITPTDSLTPPAWSLIARRVGYKPAHRTVLFADLASGAASGLDFTLETQAAALPPVTVRAGSYTAGEERGAALTALQVATTPGATADVARAIQTLPGVQNVDEGTGLFVRGGDVSETKVLLNDAVMLSPYNYETPTGNYTATLNPFLLDGIYFSSGGFGARYGNILSGVADLRTQGRPLRTSETAVVGLAALSGGADVALPYGVGIRGTATRSDADLLFRLNGSTREYAPAPNGHTLSGSAIWNYRPTQSAAEIKVFTIAGRSAFGVAVDDPSFSGGYSSDVRTDMTVVSWKDLWGAVAANGSMSYAAARRDEGFGAFDLANGERWGQYFGQLTWSAGPSHMLRVGGDGDWRRSRFTGSIPASASDVSPGARITKFDSADEAQRSGLFVEGDWHPADRLRIIGGARTDYSTESDVHTVDPRLSAALRLFSGATVTAAWGIYHQVPDPLYYEPALGSPHLAPESARQVVLGAQVGDGVGSSPMLRVELYDKSYEDLAQLTRDKLVVGHGTGFGRGVDLFAKGNGPWRLTGRVSYSYLDALRTDPNTGEPAPPAFDVTSSLTAVVDRQFGGGWSVSGAYRYASGKPYTPVVSAAYDAQQGVWIPTYGAPGSERLPDFQRVDLSLSKVKRFSPRLVGVFFAAVNNLLDRDNVYQYRYTADYSRRVAVRSLFNRSLYVGGTLTRTGN